MSQITLLFRTGLILTALLFAAAGCGTPNEQAPFDIDEQGHAADWRGPTHADAARTDMVSCRECHGEELQGGIAHVACDSCHVNGLSALTGCTSCHGNPPAGATAPDRSGAHAGHYAALPNTGNVCDTCHSGAGSGSVKKHNNGVVEVGVRLYSAKSGTAKVNADGTCSKVSCHGGQTTPAWLSGTTINVNSQCTACHAYGTAQYNSFSSGKHDFHVNTRGFFCLACHDATKLSLSHFTSLNTTSIMEGPASATINDSLSYANHTCAADCHDSRDWLAP